MTLPKTLSIQAKRDEFKALLRKEGVCVRYPACSKQTDGVHALCDHCREATARGKLKYRAKPKLPGQCASSDCNNEATEGYRTCPRCRDGKNLLQAKHRASSKVDVFDHYGWTCALCGEAHNEFLTIDHIDGGGRKHTKEIHGRGTQLYQWLRRNKFPEGFRTLCMSCNFALGFYGTHEGATQVCRVGRPSHGVVSEEQKAKQREYTRQTKLAALTAYGGACACCGEKRFEVLTIDHVDGGGGKHRKELAGKNFYVWLKLNSYPPGFRVLCANCNFAYGHFGSCPHQTPSAESL